MNVGQIKWFGGVNYKKCSFNDFGFIIDLVTKKEIYFHKNVIDVKSHLANLVKFENSSRSLENQIVAYESTKNGNKVFVTKLCLLSEITDEQVNQLDDSLRKIKKVKNKLIAKIPDYYLKNNLNDYLPYLHIEKVFNLFIERYSTGYFKKSFAAQLNIYLLGDNKLKNKKILYEIDWVKENYSDIVNLCKTLYNKKISVAGIYNKERKLISEYPQYITFDDMLLLINYGYLPSNEDLERLILNAYDEKSVSILCDALPIEYIINNERCIDYITYNKFKECLLSIDWKNNSLNYIQQYEELLAKLEADLFPEISILLCQSMQECNKLFNENWWRFFTNSFKIRILIFCSNFNDDFSFYTNSIKNNILEFEQSNNENCNIFYALLFFYGILGVSKREEKQQKFMKGHERLIKAIVESYNRNINIEHELRTLLEQCFSESCMEENILISSIESSKAFHCDGKIWSSEECIYCPERPLGGGKKCYYRPTMDLTYTKFKKNGLLQDQHLTDFLLNLDFEPDLEEIWANADPALWEYSYKISAYVNRLIDMKSRMICSVCGETFVSNFAYAKKVTAKLSATVFSCSTDIAGHDKNIYLNYCFCCGRPIDSRECKRQDSKGYYQCMCCGGTKYIKEGTICPVCGEYRHYYIESTKSKWISCASCGHNGKEFYINSLNKYGNNNEQVLDNDIEDFVY